MFLASIHEELKEIEEKIAQKLFDAQNLFLSL